MGPQLLKSRSLKKLFSFSRRETEKSRQENSTCAAHEANLYNKPTWKCFSYEEIFLATSGFHHGSLVGRGGHAEVYRGVLQDGRVVAVKKTTRNLAECEKEFLSELGTVSHVHHRNISALIGCCIDKGLYLVFTFASLGSVSSHLHDENLAPLSWKSRYQIVLGTAKGLRYLHHECRRRIIHRDIKASNILLTESFEPQISDFGLAKWLPSDWSHRAVRPIEGTFGYLAPEYFMHGIVDEKTDVFAFGVFLLEVISGRKPVDGTHRSLLNWAKPYLSDRMVQSLVDPRLGDNYDMEQLTKLSYVAFLCIKPSSARRPTMNEVLELLVNGKVPGDSWQTLQDKEEEEDEYFDLDDLDECHSPTSSSCASST